MAAWTNAGNLKGLFSQGSINETGQHSSYVQNSVDKVSETGQGGIPTIGRSADDSLLSVSGNSSATAPPNPVPALQRQDASNTPPPPPLPIPTPEPFPFLELINTPPIAPPPPPAVKPPSIPGSGSASNPFSSAFSGLKGLLNTGGAPNASTLNPAIPAIVPPTTTAPVPPRLPDGLDPSKILADYPAHYQGGHPEWHHKLDGRFILAETGLFFVGETPECDLAFPVERIRDVLKPIVGEFPPKMLNQANLATLGAQIGAGVAKFASTWMGDKDGLLVKAVGGAASDAVKGSTALGPPPKNRITVVFLDSHQFPHQVLFDFGGTKKVELEQRAEEFWMRVTTIRPRFAGASGATPAAKQAIHSVAGPTPSLNLGSGEFRLLTPGNPVETVSGPDLSERLRSGEVGFGTLICLELWVPVQTIAAFTGLSGAGGGLVKRSAPPFAGTGGGEPSRSGQGFTGSSKSLNRRGSGTGNALAAGVAGAMVGAVAGAALSNAMRNKGADNSVVEIAQNEEATNEQDELLKDDAHVVEENNAEEQNISLEDIETNDEAEEHDEGEMDDESVDEPEDDCETHESYEE